VIYTMAIITTTDGAAWKSSYYSEVSVSARKAAGEKSYMLLTTADDPNKFVLLNEWEDADKMHEFIQSEALRELQADSGVVGRPEMFVFADMEKGSVA